MRIFGNPRDWRKAPRASILLLGAAAKLVDVLLTVQPENFQMQVAYVIQIR